VDTTNGLIRRVERLESIHGGRQACLRCGSSSTSAVAFAGGAHSPPPWAENGACRDCGRLMRWYVGIDLALV
jgi:hypothetical protein